MIKMIKILMKNSVMKTSIFTLLLFISSLASAQVVSGSLITGIPQNDFRDNTQAVGVGLDATASLPIRKGLPIYAGVDLSYMIYGISNRKDELLINVKSQKGNVSESWDWHFPVNISSTNNIVSSHIFLRGYFPLEKLQPYVEVLLGTRYFFTSASIKERNQNLFFIDDEDNVIVEKTFVNSWILSYGVGGGVMIDMGYNFFIDVRVDFVNGNKTKYFDASDTRTWTARFIGEGDDVTEDNISRQNLDIRSNPKMSTTDMLNLKLGLAYRF